MQPDGKVCFLGRFGENDIEGQIFLRLERDGRIDSGFALDSRLAPTAIVAFALQSDGKIVVAGVFGAPTEPWGGYSVARLNPDGSQDRDFTVGQRADHSIQALVVQPVGKVLIAGPFTTIEGIDRKGVARINTDGSLDASFNPGAGIISIRGGRPAMVEVVALGPDGKVLIGGLFDAIDGIGRRNLARLHPDGSLDASFRADTDTGWNATVSSFAVQPDGRIVIGGGFSAVNGAARPRIARLLGDPAVPALSIERSEGIVILSWPLTSLDLQLTASSDLSAARP